MKNRLAILASAALFALPISASAHAMLDHATPAVGSVSSTAPREVVLFFTEQLEPKFSGAEVQNSSGTSVAFGPARASGTEMRMGLKALPPGAYKVIWHALSVDTHRTQGSFSFRVGQ